MKKIYKILMIMLLIIGCIFVAGCTSTNPQQTTQQTPMVTQPVIDSPNTPTQSTESQSVNPTHETPTNIPTSIIGTWKTSKDGADLSFTFNNDNTGKYTLTMEGTTVSQNMFWYQTSDTEYSVTSEIFTTPIIFTMHNGYLTDQENNIYRP